MATARRSLFALQSGRMSSVLNDRYELGPVLGRGGMGVVHRGRDRLLEREVAIKLVLDGHGADARFVDEAKRTAALNHPGIVAVFDAGQSEGQAFIVMELLCGESLEDRLTRLGKLPIEEVLRIGLEVCDALAFAHEHDIIHRDIKPANIFLAERRQGAAYVVKVVDFGIAKKVGETQLTDPGTLVGSYATMSPEQIRGEVLDGRSDLYSLGVVLYRAATGAPLFAATNAAGLVIAHLNERVPELPIGVDGDRLGVRANMAIQRLLAKDRADRPASAGVAKGLFSEGALTIPDPLPQPVVEEIPDLAIMSPSRLPEEDEHAVPILALLSADTKHETSFDVDATPAPPLVTKHAAELKLATAIPRAPEATGLQAISPELSKRIAAYSALLLIILMLLFNVHWLVLGGLGALTVFGVVAYVAATRRN